MVWTFALFWFSIFDNFDCSYAFDYSYILLFNLAFTSLPVILMGILDQDVSDKVSLAVPQLYRRGIERKEWTQWKFWLYMVDGLYQSLLCFFFAYLNFRPANALTESGRGVEDYKRLGIFVANPAVIIVNTYIFINTYRWDWFFSLITGISILLIFFWTGVYSSFTTDFTFYQSGAEVYGNLSFWANLLLTVVMCLMPRFTIKSFQKMYMPRDVDIVREQIRQGKFDYLNDVDPDKVNPVSEKFITDSASSSEESKPMQQRQSQNMAEDDTRPIYPPSVITATTHNTRTANGSDGTEYTGHEDSFDRAFGPPVAGKTDHSAASPATPNLTTPISPPNTRPSFDRTRPSIDRARPSFDRFRSSMDRTRASFEASHDFTSAAYLTRVESSQSGRMGGNRMRDISRDLRD